MRRRAHAFLAGGHTAVLGDLLADLGRRQHTADAGFGALAELDRDALDEIVGGLVGELVRIEVPVLGAGAEIAGPDLPDDVGAAEVIRRQPALPGVVRESALAGAGVQGAQRIGRQRAETHRRHVE